MNVLIIYAHPNPDSFNAAMRQTAVGALSRAGHSILISDLYALHFNPVLGKAELEGNLRQIQPEIDKVRRADLLLFQFPLWWYSMPAIMKGWIDRVFAEGFAYSEGNEFETGLLKGKKAMLSFTVGYPESYFQESFQRQPMGIVEHIHYGMFAYVGMEVLPPYIVYGPGLMDDVERKGVLEHYRQYLQNLHHVRPLDFG